MTRVIIDRPPNYKAILAVFPSANREAVIFAYAPNIYTLSTRPLPPPLIAHEKAHIERQEAIGVDVWWEQYMIDPKFRFEEELIAHRAEYHELIATAGTRQQRRLMLKDVAKRLSSGLYGNMLTLDKAMKAISQVDPKGILAW